MADDAMSDIDDSEYRQKDLPEGVTKEIIKEADSSQWRYPKKNEELTVHYVGTLEDGTQFDSSRDRGEPIKFRLGQGQVIKGWEHGFATMKKGEIAKLTIQPKFAYGEAGNPPTIPPNAVLIFEVELISWVSEDDVFRDGKVIKVMKEEGEGFETPSKGAEVLCSIRVLEKGGEVIQEKLDWETTVGSCTLEPEALANTIDKVLKDMKTSEKCCLECAEDYIFKGKGAVKIEMHLQAVYETTDVSFLSDGSVMKKRIFARDSEYHKPGDDVEVRMRVEAVTDGSSSLSGFSGPKEISFKTGAGKACDALECAAVEMKLGERSIVTCSAPSKCTDDLIGISNFSSEKVVFTLEMLEFGKERELHSMGGEEKMLLGMRRKEQGGDLFKQKRFELALMKYEKVTKLMGQNDNMSKDCKARAADLKHTAEMNKVACYLQLGEPTKALAICNTILAADRNNAKALLRRAKAHFSRHEYVDAQRDLERHLELEPDSTEAKSLLPQVKRAQKVLDKESASAYKTMFENIGKVGFGKENKKPPPPPKKEEPEDEQSKDHVTVSFKLDHKIEPGEQIWVTGQPEGLGAWDASKGVQLKRTPGPPDYEAMALGKPPRETHLWEATTQLPVAEGRTEYHYVVKSSAGDRVEGEKHVMQLAGMGGSRFRCADKWRDRPTWEPPTED
jgi:FK506-binding protein 4/5